MGIPLNNLLNLDESYKVLCASVHSSVAQGQQYLSQTWFEY